MDSDDEEDKEVTKVPKFPIQMYISEGNKYLRLGKYDTAIQFFSTALEREPTNEKSLIGRSRCYMQLGKFEEAKRDALAALEVHPKSCDAVMLIGEVDYFLGDFEKAFLTFHKGYTLRKNDERLKFGHQMCRKAIDNALQQDKPLIMDEQDTENLRRLEDDPNRDPSTEVRIRKDQFTSDVDFVNSLLDDDATESVHPECEFLKDYLRDRQVFWKTQNPKTAKKDSKDSGAIVERRKPNGDLDLTKSSEAVRSFSTEDTDSIHTSSQTNTFKDGLASVKEQVKEAETKTEEMLKEEEVKVSGKPAVEKTEQGAESKVREERKKDEINEHNGISDKEKTKDGETG